MMKRTKVCQAVLVTLGGVMLAGAASAQERIVVTGSRILRADLLSTSPMVTVSAEQLQANQDITLETMLNALPQVNPAGTTTSNNPGNGGQANIDLRGLGPNRNLVLIDGRRPMVSASDQSVDVNTIPLALIDSIEVISGGAAAVYGTDAVAGVVNVKLKRNFQGLDVRAGYQNAMDKRDAAEQSFSVAGGMNFAGNRGNAAIAYDYVKREQLIKSQRSFAAVATSTTSFFPEGTYRPSGANLPSQAAVNALYAGYGYTGPQIPNASAHGFNTDGSLFYPGVFNSPLDVTNWRYPVDSGVNTNIFPDAYSYNFDAVNILTLPLQRNSLTAKMNLQVTDDLEFFGRGAATNYTSRTAIAPTPVSTVTVAGADNTNPQRASSSLVANGANVGTALIVPVTNPFIPADLLTLLNSRTADDTRIVGSGATEPFLMRWRTLGAGLREQNFSNNVTQLLGGARGGLFGTGWTWEAYLSEGKTVIGNTQTGNIDTNRLLGTLAAADGGASQCAGGVNPFGRQPLSAACSTYLQVDNTVTTTFKQSIGQAFVTGDIVSMPAGALAAVAGLEWRNFKYTLDPGTAAGPISGFNTQSPAGGENSFRDVFGELQIPLARRATMAHSLDLSLALRNSESQSFDTVQQISGEKQRSNSYAMNATWAPTSDLRTRFSLQKTVRAPNFTELFDGGGSAPQYYDPCSVTSVARQSTSPNSAALRTLCQDAGSAGGLATLVDTYVQTPGSQASITTGGNPRLKPETGNSITLGLVFAPSSGAMRGFTTSIDYYQMTIKDAITVADVNELIADCYNFYGRNPTYDANYGACSGIFRAPEILGIDDPNSPTGDGVYAGTNGGRIRTSGIDFSLGWAGNAGPGKLGVRMDLNYLLSYKLRSTADLPEQEYRGTIPYFGAGLGQAFPRIKARINTNYAIGPVAVDFTARYIDKMKNRMEIMFPGEQFTGTAATTYFDLGMGFDVTKGVTLRAGINNLLDQEPRTYAPNVQSGTDPSTFDVIGRRFFVQAKFLFN